MADHRVIKSPDMNSQVLDSSSPSPPFPKSLRLTTCGIHQFWDAITLLTTVKLEKSYLIVYSNLPAQGAEDT